MKQRRPCTRLSRRSAAAYRVSETNMSMHAIVSPVCALSETKASMHAIVSPACALSETNMSMHAIVSRGCRRGYRRCGVAAGDEGPWRKPRRATAGRPCPIVVMTWTNGDAATTGDSALGLR